MKKYVMLFTFTLVLTAAILISGQIIKKSRIPVTVVKASASTAEDTVTCTGKVEALTKNDVFADASGVAKKVYVKEGDRVQAGQPLMKIVNTSASSSAASSGSSTSSAVPSYNNAYEAYAAYLGRSQSSSVSSGGTVSSGLSGTNSADREEASVLTAPVSGVVASIAASADGTYIDSSEPAAVIQNEDGIQVRLSVDESKIAGLKTGQRAQISGVGFKNSTYSGIIEKISSEAKDLVTTTGQETVVEVIASVQNPGPDIKPGFTAQAKITTSHSNNVLILPYEAVQEDADGKEFVYCVVVNKAIKTPVVTGREFDNGFEIKSGIRAQDLIITNPGDVYAGADVLPTTASGDSHD